MKCRRCRAERRRRRHEDEVLRRMNDGQRKLRVLLVEFFVYLDKVSR